MAEIRYHTKEIVFKILYWGPHELRGQRDNILHFLSKLKPGVNYDFQQKKIIEKKRFSKHRSMITIDPLENVPYFEYSPVGIPKIRGELSVTTKIYLALHTEVHYSGCQQLYVRDADGICFVADSSQDHLQKNISSLKLLCERIEDLRYEYRKKDKDLSNIKVILQYNNSKSPDALPIEVLNKELNEANYPWCEANAKDGNGVFETYEKLLHMIVESINKNLVRQKREKEREQIKKSIEVLTSPSVKKIVQEDITLNTVIFNALPKIRSELEFSEKPVIPVQQKHQALPTQAKSAANGAPEKVTPTPQPSKIKILARNLRLSPYPPPHPHPLDDPHGFLLKIKGESSPSTIRIYSKDGIIEIWDIVLLKERIANDSMIAEMFASREKVCKYFYRLEKEVEPLHFQFIYECVKWIIQAEGSCHISRRDLAKILRDTRIDGLTDRNRGFPSGYRRFFNSHIGKLSEPNKRAEELRDSDKYGQRLFSQIGRKEGCVLAVSPDRMWIHD